MIHIESLEHIMNLCLFHTQEMTLPPSLTPLCTPTQKKNFSFPQVSTTSALVVHGMYVWCPQVSHGGSISQPLSKSSRSQTGGKRSGFTKTPRGSCYTAAIFLILLIAKYYSSFNLLQTTATTIVFSQQ